MDESNGQKRKAATSDESCCAAKKLQKQTGVLSQVKVEDPGSLLTSQEQSPANSCQGHCDNGPNSGVENGKSGSAPDTANSTPGSMTKKIGNGMTKIKTTSNAGHRPVTSCTHCRQHKIKCNASEKFPAPCTRCERMGLHCEIDPQFRPKKGSQLQSLRNDVDELKVKIEYLTRNESLIAKALRQTNVGENLLQAVKSVDFSYRVAGRTQGQVAKNKISVQTYLTNEPQLLQDSQGPTTDPPTTSNSKVGSPSMSEKSPSSVNSSNQSNKPQLLNDSVPTNTTSENLPPVLQLAMKRLNEQNGTRSPADSNPVTATHSPSAIESSDKQRIVATTNAMPLLPSPHANIDEFVLGDVCISMKKATELHDIFVKRFLPYFPIMQSNSAAELYSQSQLLFWTVILTASLSDPEPSLYNKLASLIKQLAIETCWIRTPRSTHISQALLILCNWPLPNQKVLDDCSYRFVGLAKSLSFQLGLHRGKFMTEFTRTQTSMPDAEKWRTRTWLGIFFADQLWSSILGLPPTSQTDYLIEKARLGDDSDLPPRLRKLICLANFQGKLCNVMGSSVVSPDGLMDSRERAGSLSILERELERLDVKLKFEEDAAVEIYYLYIRLMICCFAFLPETPPEDQTKYVTEAYLCSTKVITLLTKLLETQQLIELPIYIRHASTYSALILFKLYLTPLLLDKYVDSARQSIVTIHRLYRNQLSAWATSVENDISRTASVLEKLNFVLITHPEVFIEEEGIISRMRSHLTGTLFYDLIWCVHEARRRQMDPNYDAETIARIKEKTFNNRRKLYPLPFYNQISKEDFETITQTTPSGTTITTLVPTQNAIKQAKQLAQSQGDRSGPVTHINGIPLSMLDETGSVNIDGLLADASLEFPDGTVPKVTNQFNGSVKNIPKSFSAERKHASSQVPVTNNTRKVSESAESFKGKPNIKPATTIQLLNRHGLPQQPIKATRTSTSILTGDPNSLFSMNNSLQANIQLNKSLSAESNGGVNDSATKPDLEMQNVNMTSNGLSRSPESSYANINVFYTPGASGNNLGNLYSSSGTSANIPDQPLAAALPNQPAPNVPNGGINSELDDFFLRQSAGWIEGNSSNDDFLGWFDINMAPEF